MKYEKVEQEWVSDFMTFIKVNGVVFVKVDDIRKKLSEIGNILKPKP